MGLAGRGRRRVTLRWEQVDEQASIFLLEGQRLQVRRGFEDQERAAWKWQKMRRASDNIVNANQSAPSQVSCDIPGEALTRCHVILRANQR